MAHIEDDFAAYTTIGDRVAAPASATPKPASSAPQGPKFGVPSKLEPFTLLAKSARGAGAANLISQAVSAPGVYVFSELLQLPSISDLATNEQHAGQYRLLELFAYGTWSDYVAARDQYPTLSAEQETKLKQLTVLSLASETRILPYSTLLTSLEISSIPLLEDLLIESIYSNIFVARLDQKARQLEILSSLGRDVKPVTAPASAPESMQLDPSSSSSTSTTTSAPSISTLLSSLEAWQRKIDSLLASLDSHLATLHANAVNQTQKSLEHEQKVRDMVKEVAGAKAAKGKGGAAAKDAAVSGGLPAGWGTTSAVAGGEMEVDSPLAAGGVTRNAISPGGGVGQRAKKRGRV
ncbi:hypothetical protein JCM11491_006735 [Sporobolomyces phaffii]